MLRIYKDTKLLADGLPYGSAVEDGVEINGTRTVQEEPLIRGLELLFFDRLTNTNDLSFTVRKQVGSVAAAMDAAIRFRQTLTGTGALVLELVAGATTHRWTAKRAKWSGTLGKPLGGSVALRYTVRTGLFTYTSSDDADYVGEQIDGGDFLTEPSDEIDGGSFLEAALPALEVDGGTFA